MQHMYTALGAIAFSVVADVILPSFHCHLPIFSSSPGTILGALLYLGYLACIKHSLGEWSGERCRF